MGSDRVVIVGAGIGGLACAVDLAARGLDVTVVDRRAVPGGKMRQIEVAGRPIDSGPTVLTMRWVFDELFAAAGAHLEDHVTVRSADVLARHAWSADQQLDLYADEERSADAIGRLAGPREGRAYRAFCRHGRRVFETLYEPFIRHPAPTLTSLARDAGIRRIPDLVRMRPFMPLWDLVARHFTDTRLRQLFARYATYCGSSPFRASATLALIAHVEQAGVSLVEGGMVRLAEALAAQVRALGGSVRCGTPVASIEVAHGRARAVRLDDGTRLPAAAVVANVDTASLAAGALGADAAGAIAPPERAPRSLSAVTWSMTAEARGFPLAHHNVFFCGDYAAEFGDIFDHGRVPREPTVYVCAQDRDDHGGRRAEGPERLFCIINAPARGDDPAFGREQAMACDDAALALLRRCGLEIDLERGTRTVTTPADFEAMFPGTGGALYGRAAHGWRAPFRRPGARSRLPGLYLAGGSVHPGPGVPMVAVSGRLAAERVRADLARGPR